MKDFILRRWHIQPDNQIRAFFTSLVKSPQLSVYLFVFGLCLLLGLIAGLLAGDPHHPRNESLSQDESTFQASPATAQQNILFIGVDHFKSQSPRLESIWLMIYLPSRFHLNLVPIYPTPFDQNPVASTSFTQIMKINQQGLLSEEFFEILHSGDVWWNHYVLLDETGLIEIINFFGGLRSGIDSFEGDRVISALPLPWVDRGSALQGQTSLLQGLCQQIGRPSSSSSDINKILRLVPNHIRTDMDVSEAVQNWLQLISTGNHLDCEFPLIGVLAP